MKGFPKILLLSLTVIVGATARVFVDPKLDHSKPNPVGRHKLHMARKMIPKKEIERMNRRSKAE